MAQTRRSLDSPHYIARHLIMPAPLASAPQTQDDMCPDHWDKARYRRRSASYQLLPPERLSHASPLRPILKNRTQTNPQLLQYHYSRYIPKGHSVAGDHNTIPLSKPQTIHKSPSASSSVYSQQSFGHETKPLVVTPHRRSSAPERPPRHHRPPPPSPSEAEQSWPSRPHSVESTKTIVAWPHPAPRASTSNDSSQQVSESPQVDTISTSDPTPQPLVQKPVPDSDSGWPPRGWNIYVSAMTQERHETQLRIEEYIFDQDTLTFIPPSPTNHSTDHIRTPVASHPDVSQVTEFTTHRATSSLSLTPSRKSSLSRNLRWSWRKRSRSVSEAPPPLPPLPTPTTASPPLTRPPLPPIHPPDSKGDITPTNSDLSIPPHRAVTQQASFSSTYSYSQLPGGPPIVLCEPEPDAIQPYPRASIDIYDRPASYLYSGLPSPQYNRCLSRTSVEVYSNDDPLERPSAPFSAESSGTDSSQSSIIKTPSNTSSFDHFPLVTTTRKSTLATSPPTRRGYTSPVPWQTWTSPVQSSVDVSVNSTNSTNSITVPSLNASKTTVSTAKSTGTVRRPSKLKKKRKVPLVFDVLTPTVKA